MPTTSDGEHIYNWSINITLTPQAERTIAALEKYYPGLGKAYDIATHEAEG
jgi:hypothetical protein